MALAEDFARVLAELLGQFVCVQLNTAYSAGEAYRWANKEVVFLMHGPQYL
uniref:hypothetical protein n=1 Tax=Cupriavidus taiwanensis TaxID=164546 RepID=UPI003F496493